MPGFFDEAGSPAQVADVSTNNASADFARANAANSGSFATPGIFDRLFGKKKPKNHIASSPLPSPEMLPPPAPLPQSPKPAISSGPSLIKRLVDQASGPARYNAQGVALVPGTPMTPEEFTKALGNSFMQAMPQLPQQPFGMPGGPTPGPGMPFNPMQMGNPAPRQMSQQDARSALYPSPTEMPPWAGAPLSGGVSSPGIPAAARPTYPNFGRQPLMSREPASQQVPSRLPGLARPTYPWDRPIVGQPQMAGGGYFARGGYPHMVGYPVPPEPTLPQRHFGGGDYVPDTGHGDGRSDHVDAKLSPGEFIMDAETVSLLGNGSNKAGAKQLETMRQGLRRQKGRALAKGKFSPDAKAPADYMK